MSDIDVDAITVPPLLFTVVAKEETNLDLVGEDVFYLENFSLGALGAVHGLIQSATGS
ncbi:MAG: hypothetical protein O6650_00055 [Actinobacteria bacterium]|nr:hypothetical protein [Actinomycetota bacterium]